MAVVSNHSWSILTTLSYTTEPEGSFAAIATPAEVYRQCRNLT